MRICIVSSAYRPHFSGVAEHVHHLGKTLIGFGHEVHILTTNYRTTHQREPLPATRIGRGLILPFAHGQFTLPIGINLRPAVKKFFRQFQFDIVHCHGIFPPELAYWAARYAQAPVVVTFHTVNPQLPSFAYTAFRSLLLNLGKKISAKIAVSHACRRWAENFFPGNYHVIPNGIDLQRFRPDIPPEPITDSCPTLLFVGRLEKRKGLKVLLHALPRILKKIPETKLLVVGDGPQKKYYQRLAQSLGILPAVRFVGAISHARLPHYYTAATLYIAPTLGGEAMGIVLLEAMACARPVIATNITGYNEIIANGLNGILLPPGNHDILADSTITLLQSDESRKNLARQARIRAEDFGWNKIGRAVEAIYRDTKV